MAKIHRLTEKEKEEIRTLYQADPEKWSKYKLAIMYQVQWQTVHYTINDSARIKNIHIVTGKQIGRASCRERVSSPV